MTGITTKRCAVYCRVSSEEGLDQAFNSIDAQREAGLAYVTAHREEGWISVRDTYEDPGYSGGNMDRPGLKRLLTDIAAGKIDLVVVYKIDRLSRSLADFAKMVEIFDEHGVTFSSITQPINSSTSMGRLMLNVLLSFAQFERELTGERIRDKIAASKRKGIWMGGVVPLGYRVENRALVVDAETSQVVRWIFETFRESGSTTAIVKALREQGALTRSGKPFSKQTVYKTLHNRVYLGELHHKGEYFPGEHEALIDQATWDAVHSAINANRRERKKGLNSDLERYGFILRGLLFTPEGDLYLPMATQKKSGKAYRYYVVNKKVNSGAATSDLGNQPADRLEAAVEDAVLTFLRSGAMVEQYWNEIQKLNPTIEEPEAAMLILRRTADGWDRFFPSVKRAILASLVHRITVTEQGLDVDWKLESIASLGSQTKRGSVAHEIATLEVA